MGEGAFQLEEQVVFLSVWVTKQEKKKEELEGCRGRVTGDKVSERIEKHLFLGILLWIGSKRLQSLVWHVAETTQIPACCLGGICRQRQEC